MVGFNVIIEGCDCVGKTSLIDEYMKTRPNWSRVKCSAPKDKLEAKIEYLNILQQLHKNEYVIYDRALLGETVYAPIFRGYFPEYMRDMEKLVPDNTYLFLVVADVDKIKERFDGLFINVNQIETIQNEFKKQFQLSNYKHKFIIDTSNITPSEASEQITRTLYEALKNGNK